jgi:hypothetical protein
MGYSLKTEVAGPDRSSAFSRVTPTLRRSRSYAGQETLIPVSPLQGLGARFYISYAPVPVITEANGKPRAAPDAPRAAQRGARAG